MENNYTPNALVQDWKFRYDNKWATDFHIEMLLKLKIITERDVEFIRTGA